MSKLINGILAAVRRGSWIDELTMGTALVGYSIFGAILEDNDEVSAAAADIVPSP